MPTNILQEAISGDIKTLFLFSQWLQSEVLESEAVLWSSEDQSCSFYQYAFPKSWWLWFASSRERKCELLGVPPTHVVPVVRVVPMAWISATKGAGQAAGVRMIS